MSSFMTTKVSNMNPQTGYLEVILGPMFSGKTSKLLEIHKQCLFCNINVVVVNYIADNRYSSSLLSTHDELMIPCIKCATIEELILHYAPHIKKAEVILINEGQFFEDIERVIELVEKDKKRVYVCGLDGDFERKKIGKILDLIPHCDKVHKLKSLCSLCKDGTHALFSFRLSTETDQVVIGSNNYIPLCRECFNRESEKKYKKTT